MNCNEGNFADARSSTPLWWYLRQTHTHKIMPTCYVNNLTGWKQNNLCHRWRLEENRFKILTLKVHGQMQTTVNEVQTKGQFLQVLFACNCIYIGSSRSHFQACLEARVGSGNSWTLWWRLDCYTPDILLTVPLSRDTAAIVRDEALNSKREFPISIGRFRRPPQCLRQQYPTTIHKDANKRSNLVIGVIGRIS